MSKNRLRLPKIEPTPEWAYVNRRQFLAQLSLGGAVIAGATIGCGQAHAEEKPAAAAATTGEKKEAKLLPEHEHPAVRPGIMSADIHPLFPAKRNGNYKLPGKNDKLTDDVSPHIYNNFYEFTTDKERVWRLTKKFKVEPWTIEITGECGKPRKFSIDDIFKLLGKDQEERTYRFRCVEAWAMDVPWTGIELGKLLKLVEPKDSAKFVRFFTAQDKEGMPGIELQHWYPWPYFEGLRMDEAMHELTLLGTGLYGRPLPKQNGAPFRIVVPWKYGYKSIKSIVKIELVEKQPTTFWEKLAADEYPFESNVNPHIPHPRWSQARERVLPDMEVRPTLLYNGYGDYVAKLYKKT